ncbi:MAG: NYN domain-containing protein [Nitrospirales bacterium]|nr:NYN domain-containing protein [Nitrospirales bacterium]
MNAQTPRGPVSSFLIIDGYNVIGTSHRDGEKARETFVALLIDYIKVKPHHVTVVFDGHKTGAGVERTAVRGGVRILYSRLGEKADDVIKRIISEERREWIVVSSDREIVHHAWSVGSIPVSSHIFHEIVVRQVKRSGGAAGSSGERDADPFFSREEEEGADEENLLARRGNPHQLSKKEKAVRKALGKL